MEEIYSVGIDHRTQPQVLVGPMSLEYGPQVYGSDDLGVRGRSQQAARSGSQLMPMPQSSGVWQLQPSPADGGVFRCDDGGDSWLSLSAGLPADFGFRSLRTHTAPGRSMSIRWSPTSNA